MENHQEEPRREVGTLPVADVEAKEAQAVNQAESAKPDTQPEKPDESKEEPKQPEKPGEEPQEPEQPREPVTVPQGQEREAEWENLRREVSLLSEKLDNLADLFARKIQSTEHEDQVIDRMHQELQEHRRGLAAQILRPVLKDIAETRDSIQRTVAQYRKKPDGKPEEQQADPVRALEEYGKYDLGDILERYGVEVYRSKPGSAFNPQRQRAAGNVPAEEPAQHGTVVESLTSGYLYQGVTLSPERVRVYVWTERNDG